MSCRFLQASRTAEQVSPVGHSNRKLSGLLPTESGQLEAVPSRSLVAVVGGSLACVQATRQGYVIGAAEAEVEFSQQFSCPSKH